MTSPRVCPDCHQPIINPGGHMEACTGLEPLDVVARKIVAGGPFHDRDAVRLAHAYLQAEER